MMCLGRSWFRIGRGIDGWKGDSCYVEGVSMMISRAWARSSLKDNTIHLELLTQLGFGNYSSYESNMEKYVSANKN